MTTQKNRVYIEEAKEAPNDAIIRRGDRGRLYYRTDERGQNNEVGGNHENTLLNEGVDKQETLSEGSTFYDRENKTELSILEVNGNEIHMTAGTHEWVETVDSAMNNLDNGSWVHLPDMQRTVEMQNDEPDEPDAKFDIDEWVRWDYGEGTSDGQVKDKKTEIGGSLSVDGNSRNVGENDPEPVYKMDVWREGDGELRGQAVKSESELRSIQPPEDAKSVSSKKK